MSSQTAQIGLYAVKDSFNEQLTVQLGSGSSAEEPAPIDGLPENEEYYLTQLQEFVDELVDGEELFNSLDRYEPTRIGTFTINGEGEVLSHSLEM